jgi:hypothetical protein
MRSKDHQSTWKTINEQKMNLENHELGTLTYWQHSSSRNEDACLCTHLSNLDPVASSGPLSIDTSRSALDEQHGSEPAVPFFLDVARRQNEQRKMFEIFGRHRQPSLLM